MSSPLPNVPIAKLEEGHIWREWFFKIFTLLSVGASGTFTTVDSKTVTVVNGIITSIK